MREEKGGGLGKVGGEGREGECILINWAGRGREREGDVFQLVGQRYIYIYNLERKRKRKREIEREREGERE